MIAYVMSVSLIIGALLVYSTYLPDSVIYFLGVSIAYLGFSKFLIMTSLKAMYRIRVEREYEKPLIENAVTKITVRLINPTLIPILYAEVSDRYPRYFHLRKGSNKLVTIIPPRGYVEFTYYIVTRIGEHFFEGVEMLLRDPLGIFAYKDCIPESKETVRVFPKPKPLPLRRIGRWITTSLGQTKSGLKGVGNEFMMLRNYNYGDDYRLIEWKSSARAGKLQVKVFEKESSLYLIILLDASPAMMYGYLGRTMLEESTRVISGLSQYLLNRGDWIGLSIRALSPLISCINQGKAHYYELLKLLSKIEWTRQYPSYTLGELMKRSAVMVPKRAKVLFLIFTTLDPSAYPSTSLLKNEIRNLVLIATKLKSLHHEVAVISPLPELYELQEMTGIEAGLYIASTFKSLERAREHASKLANKGIQVIQVGPSTLLPRLITYIERFRSVIP